MINWDKYPEKDESCWDEFDWADLENDERRCKDGDKS